MAIVELLLAPLSLTSIFYSVVIILSSAIVFATGKWQSTSAANPFERDCRKPLQPPVTDKARVDRVLKQGFSRKKVPEDLDAIVIGSGIGGLTSAAILAKAGKKVLVLEQHDRAGGCTHTFTEKGFEFDVGIHYVGQMHVPSFVKFLMDQISYGQLQWQPLDEEYDKIVLGSGVKRKEITLVAGKLKESLLKAFPDEKMAIDQFMAGLAMTASAKNGFIMLKTLPMWVARFLYWTGILDALTSYSKFYCTTSKDYIDALTDNQELRAALNYTWGNFGVAPSKSSAMVTFMLLNHCKDGLNFPVGGASQIALNIIPVIEDAGGKVLVRAKVKKILMENGRAVGVRVSKGQGDPIDIHASTVISNAGVLNTKTMVPKEIFAKSNIASLFSNKAIEAGLGALTLFVGLKGTTEELKLKVQNIWVYTDTDVDGGYRVMAEETIDMENINERPLIVITFPSAKDPTWSSRYPGKTTVTVISFSNYDMFRQWDDEKVRHRGPAYEEVKEVISQQIWSQVTKLYPQLKGKVEYMELGSSVTNNFYIGATRGEIYGLDHTTTRFSAEAAMKLRPDIGIPGLYIGGQDVSTCGLIGGMLGGVMAAGAVLNRNVLGDGKHLFKRLSKEGTVLNLNGS